ncbi:MAG: DUF2191 domain-containing protein [Bryobacterales bacterium]|nr:DUF2191 domain-containing protein [Bryobacterales bacterium]
MRTTLTLEPDVALKLKRKMAARKLTLKDAVNQALRIGLTAEERPKSKPFRVEPFSMQFLPGIDQDKLGQLADQLEDEEIVRKLRL